MEKLVSIIVPIYNVEKYLRQCLDSILRQTFRPLEIILVNDGSTDGSDTICQEYAEIDERIVYLKKENGGVSDARNVGLDAVTSDYVLFIDSDDWIEPTYVEVLYEKIEEYQADIVFENYTSFNDEDSNFYFHMSNDYYEEIYDNYSVMNLLNDSRESKNAALIVPWAKIYRKEILNDLHFPLARTGEDALFNLKVFLKSEKIVYIHKGSYIYRHRGESLSRNWTVDWFNESLLIQEERLSMLATLGYPLKAYKKGYRDSLNFFISEIENRGLPKSPIFYQMKEKRELLNNFSHIHQEEKKAIILACSFDDVNNIHTVIKSICFHNRSIRFYLIHHDFPYEWFQQMKRRLEEFDSDIIDCRLSENTPLTFDDFDRFHSLIVDFVEEKKALYLDQNILITKNLEGLFSIDLEGYPIATVKIPYASRKHETVTPKVFFINFPACQKENTSQTMMGRLGDRSLKLEGDGQNDFNCLSKSNWLELDIDYNDLDHPTCKADHPLPKGQDFPGMISYLPHEEPWRVQNDQEYRKVWWFYHNLEWTELGGNYHLHALQKYLLDSFRW